MSGLKIRTVLALGVVNILRASCYRIGVKTGLHPVCRIHADIPEGIFFSGTGRKTGPSPVRVAASHWLAAANYFGWYKLAVQGIPDWHANPFNGRSVNEPKRPWWKISDFDENVGDIKTVWEASRMDWALSFAQHAANGDDEALRRLNLWLSDWVDANPPWCGPNWKCGQEASIRVMHLAMSAIILNEYSNTSGPLLALVEAHLRRIAPTLSYAIAQDNNHGTSEAAALFIGGSWLSAHGVGDGKKWTLLGRKWLENRAARLIEKDGSFSQYSVNYHRLMLDTYSMAECWRRRLSLASFSDVLYGRLSAATQWLYQMTQAGQGDAPNLGANDGARLLPLSDSDYRDFRPSVQLSMALFCGRRAYAGGDWNLPLQWLDIALPDVAAPAPETQQFPDGGYSILRRGSHCAVLRYPRFRFRPGQSDALHVDLWSAGRNLLRDAGTYSYNEDDQTTAYFGGTASHNTVQFDGRDQMPRISKFLFGDWLQSHSVIAVADSAEQVSAAAGYTNPRGATHVRKLALTASSLQIEDEISGFESGAVLRWRLLPGQWKMTGNAVWLEDQGPDQKLSQKLSISATMPIVRMAIIEGWESRYYMKKTPIPVLEVEFSKPGTIISTYQFTS